jgi:RimJ/RimL family protein N-acetyltransferase
MVEGDEVVGMISFKGPPRGGVVEIGYGVAESRRGRGHATRAVALTIV